MSVGNIIFEQLKTLGFNDLMCWGARNFMTFDNNTFKDITHAGGLVFQVNGLKHKQKVMIRLKYNDTYHVEIGNIIRGSWVKKKNSKEYSEVYFDQLVDIIDDMVEGTKYMCTEDMKKTYGI